ncbi:hypothetical protein ACWGE1_21600 [Streptomyces sp. NPDC054932]
MQVAGGWERVFGVLVVVLGFFRFLAAVVIPARRGGGVLSGMWLWIRGIGRAAPGCGGGV